MLDATGQRFDFTHGKCGASSGYVSEFQNGRAIWIVLDRVCSILVLDRPTRVSTTVLRIADPSVTLFGQVRQALGNERFSDGFGIVEVARFLQQLIQRFGTDRVPVVWKAAQAVNGVHRQFGSGV